MTKNIFRIATTTFGIILLMILSISSLIASDETTRSGDSIEDCTQCDFGDAPESYGPGGIKSFQGYTLSNFIDDTSFLDSEDYPNYSPDATGDDFSGADQISAEESGWIGSQVGNMYYHTDNDTFDISFYLSDMEAVGFVKDGSLGMWFDYDQSGTYDADEAYIFQHDELEITKFYDLEGRNNGDRFKYRLDLEIDMTDTNQNIKELTDSSFDTFIRFRTFSDDFVIDPADAATNFANTTLDNGETLQGSTEDYQIRVLVDNPAQVCTTVTGATEQLDYASKELSSDKQTITYKDVTLQNGDVVDVVINSSGEQELAFNGDQHAGETGGPGSDFRIIPDEKQVTHVTGVIDNDLAINIYEAGTTTDYPLALTFQMSGAGPEQTWGFASEEDDIISLGGHMIKTPGANGIDYYDYSRNDYWISDAMSYGQGIIYSSQTPKSQYDIEINFDYFEHNYFLELGGAMVISTSAYEDTINLDDCNDENLDDPISNGFTDDDETRTDDVQGVAFHDDLTIESSAITYYNYPDNDFLGYEITIPAKYEWEESVDNIVVYSADDSSVLDYDNSAWSVVDPEYISHTYNDGVLQIQVKDTYPGFDDLVNNNNQFKFEVSGFMLVDFPAAATVSTEQFDTRAYVESTTDGEKVQYDHELNPVYVTDEVTELFFNADNIRVSTDKAEDITESELLDMIDYEYLSMYRNPDMSIDTSMHDDIMDAGKNDIECTLPLTIYLEDGQEVTIDVELYMDDVEVTEPTDPEESTDPEETIPEITEEEDDDAEIQETGFNYSTSIITILVMTSIAIIVLKKRLNI